VNGRQAHIYKTAEGCDIGVDVHLPDGARRRRPGIVWIHGGALIMGSRRGLARWQLDRYLQAGFLVIAIDYRLAPETKLSGIVEDLQDAFRWARERGPELFGLAPTQLSAVGHSAGGYLTLMAGRSVEPPPQALVAFYGYGDIVGSWYSRPDPFYCRMPAVTDKEAYAAVGHSATSESYGERGERRGRFYLYCRQRGLWPREVSGHDPDAETEWFKPYCPAANVSPCHPATLLLHGDCDTDVPYEQSQLMANALERAGVEHELITIAGGVHGFDGSEKPPALDAMNRVMRFLHRHAG